MSITVSWQFEIKEVIQSVNHAWVKRNNTVCGVKTYPLYPCSKPSFSFLLVSPFYQGVILAVNG